MLIITLKNLSNIVAKIFVFAIYAVCTLCFYRQRPTHQTKYAKVNNAHCRQLLQRSWVALLDDHLALLQYAVTTGEAVILFPESIVHYRRV